MILLDTHVLLWYREGSHRLGPRAREALDAAVMDGEAAISAITFWELALLVGKGRIDLPSDVQAWRRLNVSQGLAEIPVDGEIGARAATLEGLSGDPADRFIVATAMEGHRLVTADRRILAWHGPVQRLDAAR
ncbi:MAG: type II toxin-antitoxin system VapC family toxin [Acidimicrobiaceae bacterium]|nr:type II toxin-antitoxin system VapC family toxin [Acidimicrobiaceae bacterium]MYE96683.1 type II toxin-antitoxin system VapC family toxin [Acidimicrobiaceae bacterium]MYH42608.1 type II toxin-antitoxin system VapC family toxin [Acidimicrobiaceae bacterium]MYI54880.1 type II toxin-antitoxin system VapC family toxin [Acidimicrobiaceae bacterium]MYJ81033.1 type II toxin-antitoxin system VapC family toxin [Acidimicrobiaceae bacterium]